MCGIAGYIQYNNNKISLDQADKLLAGINHRGPDENGRYIDGNVALLHSRLSIIDLQTGKQPMHDVSQDYTIVFNGEIFNYIELRNSLKLAGYTFKTTSDTEVLLNAFIEWGEKCLPKLNGFWSFCIYNKKTKTFFMSRDRYGIKPLYYKTSQHELLFASEIRAILSVSPSGINKNELWDEITFGSKNGGATSYVDIYELEPGTYLTGSSERNWMHKERYYDLLETFPEKKQTLKIEEIEELLIDSIRLRLRSDVPLGTLNSGGLDSSYISSVVKKKFQLPIETFSVAPELGKSGEVKDGDESYYAELLSRHIGSKHSTIRYTDEEYFNFLNLTNDYDDSFMIHPNTVALFIMLKKIKQNTKIKVLLGGDGADEIFRGYSNNTYADFLIKTKKIPFIASLAKKYFYKKFKGTVVESLDNRFSSINKLAIAHNNQRINGSNITNILGIKGEMSNDRLELIERSRHLNELDQLIYYEQNCYLAGHLKRVDRMSMRVGIEVRLPFLDYRLVNSLNSLSFSDKFRQGERNKKRILKKLGENYLPEEINHRIKKGFSAPIDHYRNILINHLTSKHKIAFSELGPLKNIELFILNNVINKYSLDGK